MLDVVVGSVPLFWRERTPRSSIASAQFRPPGNRRPTIRRSRLPASSPPSSTYYSDSDSPPSTKCRGCTRSTTTGKEFIRHAHRVLRNPTESLRHHPYRQLSRRRQANPRRQTMRLLILIDSLTTHSTTVTTLAMIAVMTWLVMQNLYTPRRQGVVRRITLRHCYCNRPMGFHATEQCAQWRQLLRSHPPHRQLMMPKQLNLALSTTRINGYLTVAATARRRTVEAATDNNHQR